MNLRVVSTCLLLASAGLPLTGCFSSSRVEGPGEASVGRQLMELDQAYRQGTISEKEYQRLRKAIIKKND